MVMSMLTKAPAAEEKVIGYREAPKKEMICVVAAVHNTGHGESLAVIQVTKNAQEAIDTVRDAEKLGYEFYGDTGICVYYLEMGKRYRSEEFELNGDAIPVNYPVLFRRYKDKGEWKEEWFNETMKFIMGLR